MRDDGVVDGEESERLAIEYPHRNRIAVEQKAEFLLALLEVGDVDAQADAADLRAPFFDPAPPTGCDLVPEPDLRLAMLREALREPLLLAACGFRKTAAREANAQHVLEAGAGRDDVAGGVEQLLVFPVAQRVLFSL